MALAEKINGLEFSSLTKACDYFGACRKTVSKYVRNEGMTKEDAINRYLKEKKARELAKEQESFELEGVIHPNLRSACVKYNVPYSKAYNRRKSGWSYERIFITERESKTSNGRSKKYHINGVIYNNIDEICFVFKVTHNTILKYTDKYNISVEKFIENLDFYMPSKSNKYELEGVEYSSIPEVCLKYNKDYEKVQNRLQSGWSLEEAVDLVDRNSKIYSGIEYNVRGMKFSSKSSMCNYYGVSISGFNRRIDSGWSLEEALGITPRQEDFIIVDGLKFKNKTDIASHFKVNRSTMNSRVSSGRSYEEAVGIIPVVNSEGVINISLSSKISSSVSILSFVANDYYKCDDNGKIKYYSKNELFEIRRKAFESGERF